MGSVHVTDRDDHDREDKTFQVEPNSGGEATAHFTVDLYTGDITMLRGTPAGTHTLTVTVRFNLIPCEEEEEGKIMKGKRKARKLSLN